MTAITTNSASFAATPATGAALLAVSGRVMLAAIFVLSGISKIADPAYTLGYINSVGLPLPYLALAGAIAVEVLGGLALALGFRTRLVGIVLALLSVVTALVFHSALSDQNQFIHFFKNIAMAGGLLQVAAFGPGRFGIDRN